MARPKKNNAAYFSHDADMRNDLKVKALRNKFGVDGYAVWCMMLEVLTDSDNFEYSFDDLNKELLAADFGIETERLTEIIYYCVLVKLIVIDNSVIYSIEHKNRFKSLLDKRERDRERIQKTYSTVKVEEISVLPEFINTSDIEGYLTSESQVMWFESFCMNNSLKADELKLLINEFCLWLSDGGIVEKNSKDLKEHFRNWYNIKKYGTYKQKKGNGTINRGNGERIGANGKQIFRS